MSSNRNDTYQHLEEMPSHFPQQLLGMVEGSCGKYFWRHATSKLTTNSLFRVCPGGHFALNTFWALAASMIAVFDFLKPLDENGVEYDISLECDNNLVRCVSFVSRRNASGR